MIYVNYSGIMQHSKDESFFLIGSVLFEFIRYKRTKIHFFLVLIITSVNGLSIILMNKLYYCKIKLKFVNSFFRKTRFIRCQIEINPYVWKPRCHSQSLISLLAQLTEIY